MASKSPRGGKTSTKKKNTRSRVQKVIDEIVDSELTNQQKLFCVLVTTDKHHFGNKTQSYITAYQITTDKEKKYARFNASRLYANDNIQKYIRKMLRAKFNDASADDELSKLMHQDKDLNSKRAAIADYNKLTKRLSDALATVGPITINIAPEIATKNSL